MLPLDPAQELGEVSVPVIVGVSYTNIFLVSELVPHSLVTLRVTCCVPAVVIKIKPGLAVAELPGFAPVIVHAYVGVGLVA